MCAAASCAGRRWPGDLLAELVLALVGGSQVELGVEVGLHHDQVRHAQQPRVDCGGVFDLERSDDVLPREPGQEKVTRTVGVPLGSWPDGLAASPLVARLPGRPSMPEPDGDVGGPGNLKENEGLALRGPFVPLEMHLRVKGSHQPVFQFLGSLLGLARLERGADDSLGPVLDAQMMNPASRRCSAAEFASADRYSPIILCSDPRAGRGSRANTSPHNPYRSVI